MAATLKTSGHPRLHCLASEGRGFSSSDASKTPAVYKLCAELSARESLLVEYSTVVILDALKNMGVRLAIDDFGTGYSSFTYLRRFPVDTIKVDQSFVHEITKDPEEISIVGAMINIGKSLNLRIVAEGVETRSQLDFLQRHACSEGQGYYFSRPLLAEQAGHLFNVGLQPAAVQ